LRTTFRDSLRSRAIAFIGLPAAYSRRIRTTVSTTNIPDPDRLELIYKSEKFQIFRVLKDVDDEESGK
jgi:hypothetical protein